MEYDSQPLQFIRSYYFQAKHLYHGVYPNVINLLYTITQFSLIGIVFVSYLTIKYISSKIYDFIEWYSKYLKKSYNVHDQKLPHLVINCILSFSFVITNLSFTIFLIISHIFSAIKFIDYGNEILGDADNHIPYIHSAFSGIAIIITITITIIVVVFSLYKREICFIITTLTSVNIIYVLSYFGPFMFLAMIHVPLLIITFVFITAVTIIILCILPILLCNLIFHKHSLLDQWRTYVNVTRIIKIILSLIFLYAILLIVIIVIHVFFLGSFNNSPSLEAIAIAIVAGLVGSGVFKYAHEKFKESFATDKA